jgi:hypothetical protein
MLGTRSIIIAKNRNTAKNNSGIATKNRNIAENKNGTTNYMEPQHQNNTFFDRKQCSLASSRGKPPTKDRFITIILKKRLLMPSTPSYTIFFYQKDNLEEDLSRNESFY